MGGLPTSTVNGFAVDPSNPQIMYVAMRAGIFRSNDAGKTWIPAANGPKNVVAVAVNPKQPDDACAVTADGQVFRSRDGGATWHAAR